MLEHWNSSINLLHCQPEYGLIMTGQLLWKQRHAHVLLVMHRRCSCKGVEKIKRARWTIWRSMEGYCYPNIEPQSPTQRVPSSQISRGQMHANVGRHGWVCQLTLECDDKRGTLLQCADFNFFLNITWQIKISEGEGTFGPCLGWEFRFRGGGDLSC